MVRVHHARDAVEPEPVKRVLVHVEPQVRQQEPQHLVVPVVEQAAVEVREGNRVNGNFRQEPGRSRDSRVPQLVPALPAAVEVLVVGAVKVVEPVGRVVARVRVHDVEEHGEAEPVRRVDQALELLGRACETHEARSASLLCESETPRRRSAAHRSGC